MDGGYIALKGFKYQFDRTLNEIFNNLDKEILIEQLQDYGYEDYHVQVKYHNTDYNAAQQKQKTKIPIIQLMDEFEKDKAKKFALYIYLKGVPPKKVVLKTTDDLTNIIGKKIKRFSEAQKEEFIKNFTLIYADDFESQNTEILQKIKIYYSKTNEEAEIYYAIISSFLLDKVTNNSPAAKHLRSTSKKEIDSLITTGKNIIFRSSFIQLLSVEKQRNLLHKLFFKSLLNREAHDRIFIVNVEEPTNLLELKDIVLTLKNKWSNNNKKVTPVTDRFVPNIFFNNLTKDNLRTLKKDLQNDSYTIKDGYDYEAAEFNLNSFNETLSVDRRIYFRFLNNIDDLTAFTKSPRKTVEIYQFYNDSKISVPFAGKYNEIQISSIQDVKHIL